jgi:hypothetical protein
MAGTALGTVGADVESRGDSGAVGTGCSDGPLDGPESGPGHGAGERAGGTVGPDGSDAGGSAEPITARRSGDKTVSVTRVIVVTTVRTGPLPG